MAVISEFLVALGLDGSDFEKGIKKAENDLGFFRSTALQVGASVASAFSLKSLTFDFSKQNRELDQMAKKLGLTRDQVYGLDMAFQAFGASEGESISVLEGLAQTMAGFQKGDIGNIGELAKIGINADSIVNAKNSYEALLSVADQAKGVSLKQRQNLASALGLTPQALDLITQGRDEIEYLAKEMAKSRPHTAEMAQASRSFTQEWARMTNSLGGALDPLALEVTKFGTTVIQWITEMSKEGSTFRNVISDISKNVDLFAYALVGLTGVKVLGFLSKLATAFKAVNLASGGLPKLLAGLAFMVAPELLGNVAERNATKPENLVDDSLYGDYEGDALEPYEVAKNDAIVASKVHQKPMSNQSANTPQTLVLHNHFEVGGETIDERVVRIQNDSAREVIESYKSRTVR
jgi:hypothetical protein